MEHHYWSRSMKLSSVWLSLHLSVCLSVRPSHHSAVACCCGWFAAVGPADRRCQLIAAQLALHSSRVTAWSTAANVGSATLSADVGSWTQTRVMQHWCSFLEAKNIHLDTLHTHTHPFNGPFPGLLRWAGTRKVKPIWILLKQETVSGSGISWAICKSALAPYR